MLTDRDHTPLIIGIGNVFRGDDALGVRVVSALQNKYPGLGEYLIASEDPSNLIDVWAGREVIFIDAVFTQRREAGKIHRAHSADDLISGGGKRYSSHGLGLMDILQMSRLLDKLPSSFMFIGVEGENWQQGTTLSENVTAAIPLVEQQVVDYIKNRFTVNSSPEAQ